MILDTVDYNQKIGTLLQDPPHIRMAKGPTETVERNTTLVRVLMFVSDSYTEGPASRRPPRLYGLPKIHKEGVSLHWSLYPPAVQVSGRLSHFVGRSMNVRNLVESVATKLTPFVAHARKLRGMQFQENSLSGSRETE